MPQKIILALFLALASSSLAAVAGEEGLPSNPVTKKVNFQMKYDPSFGGIFLRNADFVDYVVEIDWVDGAVHLSYTSMSGHEGNVLPAGMEVTMPVRTGDWRVIGDNGRAFPVKVEWGAVKMVTLRPYGDERTVGTEACDGEGGAAVPVMTRQERPAESMPRVVELPPQPAPHMPMRRPFGINRPSSSELLEYMREHDPEGYEAMKRQFHDRFPDRNLP